MRTIDEIEVIMNRTVQIRNSLEQATRDASSCFNDFADFYGKTSGDKSHRIKSAHENLLDVCEDLIHLSTRIIKCYEEEISFRRNHPIGPV